VRKFFLSRKVRVKINEGAFNKGNTMLKTRVITALALLAILLPILISGSNLAFTVVACLFLGAAIWESQRLFHRFAPIVMALAWGLMFLFVSLRLDPAAQIILFYLCLALWICVLVPALYFYLPGKTRLSDAMMSRIVGIVIFGSFVAMSALFARSPLFLLSAMALVWVADIGAYFFGKAFGKNKLAPVISPGKSWEGALGGWLTVIAVGVLCVNVNGLHDTVPTQIYTKLGWFGLLAVLTLICAASVVGDLFESLLKRRAQIKDSSNLLPGHGGVFDRIDALIPVLPLIAVLNFWLR
jgi:phosphatidate cytidylyltransferase